jgi:hypothetical protein
MNAWELMGAMGHIEGHKGFVKDGLAWSVGGMGNGGEALATVTYSDNGAVGRLLSHTPDGLAPRFWHAACVHDNRMYVSGGEDENNADVLSVQSSLNGLNWETNNAAPPYPARSDHGMVSFLNKLVVFGGRGSQSDLNDVWSSRDGGLTWIEELPVDGNIWSARDGMVYLVFKNRLYVIAGGSTNDVWYTEDLRHWVQVTASAEFSARTYADGCVFDNRMWVFGGDVAGMTLPTEIWSSLNGEKWERGLDFPVNEVSDTLIIGVDNRLFVYGGDGNEHAYYRLNLR